MKRKIGLGALVSAGGLFVVWMLMIFTRACFDPRFEFLVPVILFGYAASIITAIICLAEDVLKFIGRCLGLRKD